MSNHILKCEREYFRAIVQGLKTFELRKNDRNFQVGDTVELRETIDGMWTHHNLEPMPIAYILEGGKYGLEQGYCILQMDTKNLKA